MVSRLRTRLAKLESKRAMPSELSFAHYTSEELMAEMLAMANGDPPPPYRPPPARARRRGNA